MVAYEKDLSFILILALVCGMMPVAATADETHEHKYSSELIFVDKDTRENRCVICGAYKIYERLSLPTYYSGEAYVENNSEGLYYGTRNIADMLGLKAGTYNNGDVSITIDGTNISVKRHTV